MGIVPRSALAWEGFPLDGFQLFAGTGDVVRYHLDLHAHVPRAVELLRAASTCRTGGCTSPGRRSWQVRDADAGQRREPDHDVAHRARAGPDLPGTPCPAGAESRPGRALVRRAIRLLTLGVEEATRHGDDGLDDARDHPQAPVLVTQNWENNDAAASAPTIQPNRLVVGHIATSGDVEVFRLPVPTVRGTRTTVYLSHIADGADFDLVVGKPDAPSLQSEPRRLDSGRLDPRRGRRQLGRQPQRGAAARDAAGHPGRLDPRREHLREPRRRGRGGDRSSPTARRASTRSRQRLQRLAQRGAVRPARRADAASRAAALARLAGSRSAAPGTLRGARPQARRRSSSSTGSG